MKKLTSVTVPLRGCSTATHITKWQ